MFCGRFNLFALRNNQFRVYCLFVFFFPGQGLDYEGVLKPDGREILAMALTSLKDAMCNLKDGSIECQLLM